MVKTVALVDGYSTARHLPEEFHRYGVNVVHVPSAPEIPEILRPSFRPDSYDAELPYAPADETATRLAAYKDVRVIAGAESGVRFADRLCELLGQEWNVSALSDARRDKFEMIRALQRAGLPTAEQISSDSPAEIVAWSRTQRDWPIVVKPPHSSSSEDVYFCHNAADIRAAVTRIVGKVNFLRLRNDTAVAQSFLEGPIYVVNTVSLDGRHLTTDAWCFEFVPGTHERRGSSGITFTDHYLLTPDSDVLEPLIEYNERALDAVGIRNGPAHNELKVTREGPRLVETNARLMGATIESGPFRKVLGDTQPELTAMAMCDPDGFLARLLRPYRPTGHLKIMWVHSPHEGVITDDAGCRHLGQLPSFAGYFGAPRVGDAVRPSTDTTGRGGFVYLLHGDADVVEADAARVGEWIDEGALFDVRPASAAVL
ncbi:ATP-grasp domain-containing protein [Nocardiopsis rhodophaea]|uniref:ATP-grasp domain-containing protein n=1 Tax=Nocardiopsis rhodophaea TaxID=280238 RepID=UPI0031D9F976